MGADLWYPLWSADTVPTTAAAIAKLLGPVGQSTRPSSRRPLLHPTTAAACDTSGAPATPSPSSSPATMKLSEPDYPAAWAALWDPIRARDAAGLRQCIEGLGMAEAVDLALADDATGTSLSILCCPSRSVPHCPLSWSLASYHSHHQSVAIAVGCCAAQWRLWLPI